MRITYGALGKLAGLTYLQAMLEVKAAPSLRCAIRNANESKIRRQLEWAVRTLATEGVDLSTTVVLRQAKRPSTPSTVPFVKRLIDLANARRGDAAER